MKKYFKTIESLETASSEKKVEGFRIEKGSSCCACGESFAHIIRDENLNKAAELIFCEACYETGE